MTDYVALRGIQAPGTSVFGYQRGDRVDESVVARWNLVTSGPDAHVAEGTDVPVEMPASVARPGEEGTRADWEAYAVAGGMSPEDAATASQDDLEAASGPDEDAPVGQGAPVRPADSANKSEWVAYAQAIGADEAWATSGTTTKSDLQGYQQGDTVALAATEANNG